MPAAEHPQPSRLPRPALTPRSTVLTPALTGSSGGPRGLASGRFSLLRHFPASGRARACYVCVTRLRPRRAVEEEGTQRRHAGVLSAVPCPGPAAALETPRRQVRPTQGSQSHTLPEVPTPGPPPRSPPPAVAPSLARGDLLLITSHPASEGLRLCVPLPSLQRRACMPGACAAGQGVRPEGHVALSCRVSGARGQLWERLSRRSCAGPQRTAGGRHSALRGQLSLEPGVGTGTHLTEG